MDKITYLAQLAEGLARWVPERERQDILRYYAEYFEEAGAEREAEVIQELGDPWALSSRLAVEGGYVSQEGAASWTPRRNKRKIWPWVLLGTAAVLVFIVGAIFTAVMNFSGLIGRAVSDVVISNANAGTTVVEAEEWAVDRAVGKGDYVIEDAEYDGTEYNCTYVATEFGTLETFSAIDAEISLGSITICTGPDWSLIIQQNAVLSGYNITWEVKGDKLKLKDSSTGKADINGLKDLPNLFGGGAIDISITVPVGYPLDKIDVSTGMGNIYIVDVYADKVEAETGMGNVECYEVYDAEKIDLKSGMGDVTLGIEGLESGVDIDLETGMGNVEANLGCFEDECEYEVESGLGNVTVNGVSRGSNLKVERKGNYPYKLDAESGMGDVNVFFYEDRW